MRRRLAATMVLVTLACFALALAGWNGSPAFAEPDQPEIIPERDVTSGNTIKKKPAHQVPAEVIEKLLEEEKEREEQARKPSSDTDFDAEEIERAEKALLSPKAPSPVAEDAPDTDTAGAAANDDSKAAPAQAAIQPAPLAAPGLPRRKPRKPVIRAKDRKKADGKKKLTRGSDRQKYLCKALQSCRNDFIRCKGKIKHPDQSPEWSVAKEKCGAIYKKCVEKDFQSGEWFFTRWFYFQELNCK